MNRTHRGRTKYIKFAMYAVVVVLINMVGMTLFFRLDLTRNQIYSLSPISKQVVATLTEPLTVKVFFSRDLPAPYNSNELYLRDLLNEYAQQNPRYFKVDHYNVGGDTGGDGDRALTHQQIARDYGIQPVQIQIVERDELKFRQAYMGLVMIHGDIVERIPTIGTIDGLEYQLTTNIQKLNHKVSALLALDEPIKATLLLSSNLYKIAPLIGIQELERYPDKIRAVIDGMGAKTYGRLVFEALDPSRDPAAAARAAQTSLNPLRWDSMPERGITADEGFAGLLLQHKDKVREIPLLRVVRLPLFGDQYQVTEVDQIEALVNTHMERLIEINEALGYLADYGTMPLGGGPLGAQGDALNNFSTLLNRTYDIAPVYLSETPIPDGLQTLVIARPTEIFSDYDLFQIDQALMRGTNLAIFMDAFEQQQTRQQPFMAQQMPEYVPLDTGLEKLLAHYGVRLKRALVMDEKCYRQRMPQQQGGGEQPLYFAPVIENARITKELDYLKNIKELITLEISPLALDADRIAAQNLTAHQLFASSDRSWEMRDRIMLNPLFIQPPASNSEMASQPLAYLLEGSFSSYFKDKPMPEKPAEASEEETDPTSPDPAGKATPGAPTLPADRPAIATEAAIREEGAPSRLFIIGSSKMITDQLLDDTGQHPNSMFILNMIDALNGREAVAAMRSKEQRHNPLNPTSAAVKTTIKALNVVGLPILVVLLGLLVWWQRHMRKKRIQILFQA
jgi:ABC-2 type transport system permease protein